MACASAGGVSTDFGFSFAIVSRVRVPLAFFPSLFDEFICLRHVKRLCLCVGIMLFERPILNWSITLFTVLRSREVYVYIDAVYRAKSLLAHSTIASLCARIYEMCHSE